VPLKTNYLYVIILYAILQQENSDSLPTEAMTHQQSTGEGDHCDLLSSDYVLYLGKVEVWTELHGQEPKCCYLPHSMTIEELYEKLGFEIDNIKQYLITVNKDRVLACLNLDAIKTSRDHPLIIEKFSYYVRYKDEVTVFKKYCNPTTSISQLPGALELAYHKGKKIDQDLAIWQLFTSKTDPLIFKDSKLTMCIEGRNISTEIPLENVDHLFSHATTKIGSKVEGVAYDHYGRKIHNLDVFYRETNSSMRCVHLQKTFTSGTCYHHSQSVSNTAKNKPRDITKYSVEHEIYHNWISLSVYDSYCKPPSGEAECFAKRFKSLMKINKYKILSDYELSYSSVFFQALDRFLFPSGKEKMCVLHEPVLANTNGHHNKPDGYIACLKEGCPSSPILVSDFKKIDGDYDQAVNESIGYFQSVVDIAKKFFPLLVMPCTPDTLSLFLCWPINETKHATIKILDKVQSENFAKFFNALKFAVDIVNGPKGRFQVEPKQGVVLTEKLKLSIQVEPNQGVVHTEPSNVYKHDGLVYKLFKIGKDSYTKINDDVVKKYLGDNYFSNMKVEKLTSEDLSTSEFHFFLLTYKFISAISKTVYTLGDFVPVAEALQKLHSESFVHSDVRMANIVFTENGGKLIDFDLTDKVGECYPIGYNNFPERHSEAKEAKSRQIVHDRHSLVYVAKHKVVLSDAQERYLEDNADSLSVDLSYVFQQCMNMESVG